MLKVINYEELYPPEYYMEMQGFDCRVAIRAMNDAVDTIRLARWSLSCIESEQDDFKKTVYLRHAIEELNSSFDLCLQIPWFYFRGWKLFNEAGDLRTADFKNRREVIRNTDDWVYIAEKECSYKKVKRFLENKNQPLKNEFTVFFDSFVSEDLIEQNRKEFTVRSLCNTIKHNHVLQFDELNCIYDFNVRIDGVLYDMRLEKVEMHSDFYEDNGTESLGTVKYKYEKDLSIDIEYKNGEIFRGIDSVTNSTLYKIELVFKECCDYYNALVELFDKIYNELHANMQVLPAFLGKDGKPNIGKSNSIQLDNYL